MNAAWSVVRKPDTGLCPAPHGGLAAYHMLRDGVEYQDLGGDYFERYDKSKTIGRLVHKLKSLGCVVEIKPVESITDPSTVVVTQAA